MPIPSKYLVDFEEGRIYHVFNRTNNQEPLFITDENRQYFLQQYGKYLGGYTDTFCWCLLPNHFHLLVRVKPLKSIMAGLRKKNADELTITEKQFLDEDTGLSELIERAFKNMFQSYSQAFNKQHSRKGNLFCKPFRRVVVNNDNQFTQAVVYIHANPQKHSLMKDFRAYKWSSYNILSSETPTQLLRKELLQWFGSKDLFEKTHLQQAQFYYNSEIAIE